MKEEIKKIVKILNSGGIILYPTDTLWGIGCDATNESAVQRIYDLKRRSDSKSMLVLTDDITKIERVVDEVPEIAYQLVEVSEKPLTIVYPKGKNLASNLLAEDGSVGIRVTKETFSKSLLSTSNLIVCLHSFSNSSALISFTILPSLIKPFVTAEISITTMLKTNIGVRERFFFVCFL